MKIDLNSKWMLKMAMEASTRNGCSFIRGVLLHYIKWGIITLIGSTIVAAVATGLLTQLYLIFTWQIIDLYQMDKWVLFFGDAWYFRLLIVGVVVSNGFLIICGLIGGLYAWVHCGDLLKKAKLPIPAPIRTGGKLVSEAVSAIHHGICPRIEFVIPVKFQGFVAGRRIRLIPRHGNSFDGGGFDIGELFGTISKVYDVNAFGFNMDVTWDDVEEDEQYEISFRSDRAFDIFELVPVEEESSPA